LDQFRRYVRAGADLVCYANKYFDAPHSTGLVLGTREMVDLVALNSFIGFETSDYHTIGRAMKVDRQEVFGVVAALREWLAMDHEARLSGYGERIEFLLSALRGVAGIEAFRISEREQPRPVIRDGVRIVFPSPLRAQRLVTAMREGSPCVWVRIDDDRSDAVNVSVAFCSESELRVVAGRLKEELTRP
jgi:L-seryl-tRNA(Ser) seleniumtransferase